MHLEVTVTAAASAETVWSLLVDVERWPTRTRSMERVRLVSAGPLAVGSRVRIKQPRLAPTTFVVTDLEPGRSFTWRSTAPGLVTTTLHEVTPSPAGTSTIRFVLDQTGLLSSVSRVALRRMIRHYVQMEADGLAAAAADAASG